jgi:hypothetical protein
LVEPNLTGIQRLECKIKRHHFGERGRISDRVGVLGTQNAARFDIDQYRLAY